MTPSALTSHQRALNQQNEGLPSSVTFVGGSFTSITVTLNISVRKRPLLSVTRTIMSRLEVSSLLISPLTSNSVVQRVPVGLILWQEELDCRENLPPASSSSLKVKFCAASVSVAIKVPTRVPGFEFSFMSLEERKMVTGASFTSNTLMENFSGQDIRSLGASVTYHTGWQISLP